MDNQQLTDDNQPDETELDDTKPTNQDFLLRPDESDNRPLWLTLLVITLILIVIGLIVYITIQITNDVDDDRLEESQANSSETPLTEEELELLKQDFEQPGSSGLTAEEQEIIQGFQTSPDDQELTDQERSLLEND